MTTTKPQPISGVSADRETVSMILYPSIAETTLGKILGGLYESIPLKINGVKISHLLFPLPTSPIALSIYFHLKIFGNRYVLTNRSMQIWKSLGSRMLSEVPLTQIEDVTLQQDLGQRFYKASDLLLKGAGDKTLMTLPGIPNAEVFRETLLKARNARKHVEAAMSVIQAR